MPVIFIFPHKSIEFPLKFDDLLYHKKNEDIVENMPLQNNINKI